MSYESEDEAGLPERVLASLRADPQAPEGLEEKTVARLRAAGVLRTHSRARQWKWVPQAIAAAMLFGAGVAFGNWHPQSAVPVKGTTAEQIQTAAKTYLDALAAATPDDSTAHAAASETLRKASERIVQIFPEDQLGFAVNLVLAGSMPAPSGTRGTQERVVWF